MDFFRVILETKTSFQLDSLGSNKLSRALIACVHMLYGVEGVENIKKSNFATSDLLLWTKEKGTSKKIFLLPKPIFPIEIKEQGNISILKKYKKSKYITEQALESFTDKMNKQLSGKPIFKIEKGIISIQQQKIYDDLIVKEIRAHNTLTRATINPPLQQEKESKTENFFFSERYKLQNSGLYFIFSIDNKELHDIIIASIQLLAERGLGKKISTGAGAFNILKIEKMDLPEIDPSESSILISHWIPSKQEIKSDIYPETYKIEKFQPINQNNKDKLAPLDSVNYITSGSILRNADKRIIGTYYEIGTEDNPQLSWGKAIVLQGI